MFVKAADSRFLRVVFADRICSLVNKGEPVHHWNRQVVVFQPTAVNSCSLLLSSFVHPSPWHQGCFHCNFLYFYVEISREGYFTLRKICIT